MENRDRLECDSGERNEVAFTVETVKSKKEYQRLCKTFFRVLYMHHGVWARVRWSV